MHWGIMIYIKPPSSPNPLQPLEMKEAAEMWVDVTPGGEGKEGARQNHPMRHDNQAVRTPAPWVLNRPEMAG